MAYFRVSLLLCLTVAVLSVAGVVKNPKTPNQILDAVIARAKANIKALGWDVSKNIQKGRTDFGFGVENAGGSSERLEITDASMTGLGSLSRSASGAFLNNESVLKGTFKLENARAKASYTLTFGGTGAAPAKTDAGNVVEKADKLFADIEINLLNKVPQSIRSYSVRSGHEAIESQSGKNAQYETIDIPGLRRSLLNVLEKTFATNIKVQINKAIQAWKKE